MSALVQRLEVAGLPLNPSVRANLQCAGYRTTADLLDVQPTDLASVTGLTIEDSTLVLQLANQSTDNFKTTLTTAKSLWEKERTTPSIFTFCAELDTMLAGGIRPGQVTEFCGVPGVGKTQLGMQLCINVQLPPVFRGAGGQAIYLDTEGSFAPTRAEEIVEAYITHIKRVAAQKGDQIKATAADNTTVVDVLKGIHYFRIMDYVEQLCMLENLDEYLDSHPAVRLVVIDSVTFHFREFTDFSLRSKLLADMSLKLMKLAADRNIAIVLMNQVTSIGAGQEGSRLAPALGDTWSHAVTQRVILYWNNGTRRAYLDKSSSQPVADVEYKVVKDGIRGKSGRKRRKSTDAGGGGGA